MLSIENIFFSWYTYQGKREGTPVAQFGQSKGFLIPEPPVRVRPGVPAIISFICYIYGIQKERNPTHPFAVCPQLCPGSSRK